MAFYRYFILIISLQLHFSTTAQDRDDLPVGEIHYVILHDSLIEGRYNEIDFASLKGWKFSPLDDAAFSSGEYDDRHWEVISGPLNEGDHLPTSWDGFGWFRLKVRPDSTFTVSHSIVSAFHSGGLEFYINDSLILKQGNPSPSESQEVLFGSTTDPGEIYTWENGKIYQLSIKYSFHEHESLKGLTSTTSPLAFNIVMTGSENLKIILSDQKGYATVFSSSSVLLFLVMVLHLFLYLKVRNEKSNFWIFLISFVIFVSTSLTTILINYDLPQFWINAILASGMNLAIFIAIGLIPIVAHKVLQVKVHVFWKYFAGYPIVIVALHLIGSEIVLDQTYNVLVLSSALLLAIVGGGIAVYKAKKNDRKDIYLIAGPVIAFPVLFVLGNILFIALEIENIFTELLLIFLLVTIIPLGFSVYQAKKFFRMHNHLDQMVSQRTIELETAYTDLENSLRDLKAAQHQLVQQEKLASLGQLTAGIAHEIKNPLNFVNNFSDLSLELVEEAKEEISKTKTSSNSPTAEKRESLLDYIYDLLDSVEINLNKILQHGRRADGIVKSMLLHSRGGSGKIEPVDLNHLIKEYVGLAFHGMRASKNPINVKIEMDLDEKIEKVPLISEDFSRVILNLCNNAFDAMKERIHEPRYSAILTVSTQKVNDLVHIVIKDNGPGIKNEIVDNILQPFFTTKKGTDGTGLGLSISNEIIKAHGGEIKIKSRPKVGATFIIALPIRLENNGRRVENSQQDKS